jgi:polysaccharide deacetylase family protein (PEP-CTERM system associated)
VINAFSVDVEEWFHVCGFDWQQHWRALPSRVEADTRRLLDLLDRRQVRATFFVLGWVAERHPALVAEIAAAGHAIGSHGHMHRRVYELGEAGFGEDLDRSCRALSAAGAGRVTAFRAPEWSINARTPWALGVLARQGFTIDSSMAPMRIVGDPAYPRQPYECATPHGALREYPPFVVKRFGQHMPQGGGWGLRFTRPATVLRRLERLNRSGAPAVFWLHPWELDPDPPHMRLPWTQWFAHYAFLDGFERRLDEVLSGASFAPLHEALAAS